MSQNDLVKVLKGAGMVLEIIVKNQRLHSNESFIKAQYHTTELIKLIFDVGLSHNSNKTNPYQQSQAASSSSSPSSSSSSTRVTNSKDSLNVESVVNEYISKEQNTPAAMKATAFPTSVTNTVTNTVDPIGFNRSTESLSQPVVSPPHTNEKVEKSNNTEKISPMRPKAVPATPFARVMGFGSLAVGLMYGQLAETTNKAIFGSDENSSSISEANANRLAESISRMRGAALKLGQMLSLQDDNFLPPTLSKALNRVRQSADYMPEYQLKEQLEAQDGWGSDWRRHFTEFDEVPIAAASIGQVHKAVLQSGEHVAVKIQYPGVARSIQSDLNNLKMIVTMANVLPKGLFIDQIIKVAGTELTAECNYLDEAQHQKRYRALIAADPLLSRHMSVPRVFEHLSTAEVLVTEFVPGRAIDHALEYPQDIRNAIGRAVLISTIKELFEWRFVQSDPNFANFLYDHPSRTIHCIDFGASREYSQEFVSQYLDLVWAAANQDREKILSVSKDIGFLSGDESREMMEAHVQTGLLMGEPFQSNEPYDFANCYITKRASKHGAVFMTDRLKAPPSETYSLHRKLAGAFLLCIRLKAIIRCRDILEDVYNKSNKMSVK